ncbi:MAG TPA: LCP family protein [Acidimicrobiales bacterium]|nr:LCP family protein [Acidimicrobiales bacterium]
MSDRFHQPERTSAGDQRRIFIPAPSSSPGRTGAAGGTSAPPRRGHDRPPPPPGSPRPPIPRDPAGPPSAPPRAGRRFRWRRVVVALVVLLVVGLLGSYLYARSIFNRIDRVEVSQSLTSSSSGTNYLIVGSDSRANVQGEGDAGFNGADAPAGQRADTMMLLHLEGGKAQMLSIPRDLYLPIAGTEGSSKINAAYNADLGGGPTRLVDTITQSLGIPIDRYMEVDFVSFAGLVDGLGGITIEFPHPAQDTESGLFVAETGPVELDGEQALAYVRSRHYQELIDGQWVEDPTADLGRMERQRAFLTQVIGKLSDTRNPFSLAGAASDMATGLRIDDKMSMFDAIRLGWGMRGKTPEALDINAALSGDRNESGAVLILDEAAAAPVLDQVR